MANLPNANTEEIDAFRRIARGGADGPVFMLNLNKYSAAAGFPDGQLYKDYMAVLDTLLGQVGGEGVVADARAGSRRGRAGHR